MNNGTMADMIMEAMQKKQGPKDTFNMRGGKGEEVKIYGSWNEFAVDRNAEGNDLLGDENFPIMRNKDGEYILDMQSYENQKSESEIIEKGEEEEQAPEQPNNNMPPKMMYGGSIKRFR